jgi:hypothetical protein
VIPKIGKCRGMLNWLPALANLLAFVLVVPVPESR